LRLPNFRIKVIMEHVDLEIGMRLATAVLLFCLAAGTFLAMHAQGVPITVQDVKIQNLDDRLRDTVQRAELLEKELDDLRDQVQMYKGMVMMLGGIGGFIQVLQTFFIARKGKQAV